MKKEIWKNIEEWEGQYQISNLGRVKSFKWLKKGGKIRKPSINRLKYHMVTLSQYPKFEVKKIHRLVAQAFIPNPYNKTQVNHKNGIKDDNRIENLEWVTCAENIQHAYRTGLQKGPIGEKCHCAKLTEFQVKRIRLIREITPSFSYRKIGKIFNVNNVTVCHIIKRKTWKHI